MLYIFNTLTNQKEEFIPNDINNITMYVCGPTVYSRPHVGNMRSVVVYDMIYRFLKYFYSDSKITFVRNITDVDDKIINKAKELGVEIGYLTKEIENLFHQDCKTLNCLLPDVEPRATEEIESMLFMIKKIVANGYAYINKGHVLFDVEKYKEYGALSKRSTEEMVAGSRVAVEDYKKNAMDFVLWKPADKSKGEQGWDSEFGYGRPGWHIECSAMSSRYLGNDFDIHGGGLDLQFPHHENEIAQSKCANLGSTFAKYWVHNGFLTLENEKMSKSLNNIKTVEDIQNDGFFGVAIKMALLTTHYRKPTDLTADLLVNSQKSIEKFFDLFVEVGFDKIDQDAKVDQNFVDCLSDDFNTAKYFAYLFSVFKDARDTVDEKSKLKLINSLFSALSLIGLCSKDILKGYLKYKELNNVSDEVLLMCKKRDEARKMKDYKLSDLIREEIKLLGYEVLDTKEGTMVKCSIKLLL